MYFRIIFTLVLLFLSPTISYSKSIENFTPIVALQKSSYIYGTYKLDNKNIVPAIKTNSNIYVFQHADEDKKLPLFYTSSLGFYRNNIILGLHETDGYRNSLLVMINLDKEPTIVDSIKFTNIDGYNYDFYSDLPSIDVPKNISDIDKDNFSEVLIDFYERRFRLLLSITSKGITIDYNSPYYTRTFNKLSKLKDRDEYEEREYTIYGVLSNKVSKNDTLNKLLEKNKNDRKAYPTIISKAIELKKLSFNIGANKYLAAYFAGEIESQEMIKILSEKGINSSNLMFEIYNFEKLISQFHIDEIAFNDFILFFSDNITEDKFKEYTSKSLSNFNGDMYSILSNIMELDNNLHNSKITIKKLIID